MQEAIKTQIDFLKHLHGIRPEASYRWFKAQLLAEFGTPDLDDSVLSFFRSKHEIVRKAFVDYVQHDTPNKKAWQMQWELCRAYEDYLYKPTEPLGLKVGDRVIWYDCPASLNSFNPFTVKKIEGNYVWLDWIYHPVSFKRLIWD